MWWRHRRAAKPWGNRERWVQRGPWDWNCPGCKSQLCDLWEGAARGWGESISASSSGSGVDWMLLQLLFMVFLCSPESLQTPLLYVCLLWLCFCYLQLQPDQDGNWVKSAMTLLLNHIVLHVIMTFIAVVCSTEYEGGLEFPKRKRKFSSVGEGGVDSSDDLWV